MSERLDAEVYQQRFTSTEPVTDALNELIQTPQDEFIFYAKKEFKPSNWTEGATENKAARSLWVTEHITELRRHSVGLGALSLQLAPPVDVIVHKGVDEKGKQLEMDFSAFSPGAYWKIMQEFHKEEHPFTPPSSVLRDIASHSLAVYLSFDDLRPAEEFNAGAMRLMQALRDSSTNYKMHITKLRGISDNQSLPAFAKPSRSPDVI